MMAERLVVDIAELRRGKYDGMSGAITVSNCFIDICSGRTSRAGQRSGS